MIHIYEADYVKPLVKVFYERAWKNTEETRRIFEEIGFELTKYAFRNVPLLKNLQNHTVAYIMTLFNIAPWDMFSGVNSKAKLPTSEPKKKKMLKKILKC